MDPVAALTRLGGIAGHADLLALTSRKRLRRAVAARRVVHVSRDRYALPGADRARILAADVDGHLRLLSAAAHWGWEVKWPTRWPQLTAALPPDASDAMRRVVAHASPLAANPFESVLRAVLIEAGFSVVPQWAIEIGGITYHPDLAEPFAGIAIEANSWAHHATKADHDADCVRYNALVIGGWVVLRFTWEQVMFSPVEVVATMRAAYALPTAV